MFRLSFKTLLLSDILYVFIVFRELLPNVTNNECIIYHHHTHQNTLSSCTSEKKSELISEDRTLVALSKSVLLRKMLQYLIMYLRMSQYIYDVVGLNDWGNMSGHFSRCLIIGDVKKGIEDILNVGRQGVVLQLKRRVREHVALKYASSRDTSPNSLLLTYPSFPKDFF